MHSTKSLQIIAGPITQNALCVGCHKQTHKFAFLMVIEHCSWIICEGIISTNCPSYTKRCKVREIMAHDKGPNQGEEGDRDRDVDGVDNERARGGERERRRQRGGEGDGVRSYGTTVTGRTGSVRPTRQRGRDARARGDTTRGRKPEAGDTMEPQGRGGGARTRGRRLARQKLTD